MSRRIPDDDLLDDLRRVAALEATSDPPTMAEYRTRGAFSPATVRDRFDTWAGALDAAGLDGDRSRHRGRTPPAALRRDLRRVADRADTSDPPTQADYDRHGRHGTSTQRRQFGSWAGALAAADLDAGAVAERGGPGAGDTPAPDERAAAGDDGDPWCRPPAVSRAALRDALVALGAREDTADPPTTADMLDRGPHSPNTYRRRFGSWPGALDAAGLDGDAARERGPGRAAHDTGHGTGGAGGHSGDTGGGRGNGAGADRGGDDHRDRGGDDHRDRDGGGGSGIPEAVREAVREAGGSR